MRNRQLDILRAVAILFVLGYHASAPLLERAGWSGVDLFFVLSGFLVSGLLFREYKQHARIQVGRFLLRRGMKIYPAFYFFIFWTLGILWYLRRNPFPWARAVAELFFFQNYRDGIWGHTWSLAVEEHFYILLPLLLLLLLGLNKSSRDPFRHLLVIFPVVATLVLLQRIIACWRDPSVGLAYLRMSHLQLDGLLFGVVVAYYYHFRPEAYRQFALSSPKLILALCSLAIVPCFLWDVEESVFLRTIGHPLLYLGFGGLMILTLEFPVTLPGRIGSWLSSVGRLLAFVGSRSYSIYLWHIAFEGWGIAFLRRIHLFPKDMPLPFIVYPLGCIILGIVMAAAVEYPFLKIRDRVFPSLSGTLLRPAEK